jgi:hypothetical protein
MKLKVLFLALFVAGLAASFAVAKPPPGKGTNGGSGHGKGAAVSTTGSATTAAAAATLPGSGRVVLCHRTGKATKWVRVSVAAKAAKQRIAKGDVWLQDPAATCAGAAAKDGKGSDDEDSGSTMTAPTTTTTVGTTTTTP